MPAITCFKVDLQQLVDRLGIGIRVARYPPHSSKYNPIEHRLFPHVTRVYQGVIFESVELVKELMEKEQTSTGLRMTVGILGKEYQAGRKYAEGFKKDMKIMFDEVPSPRNGITGRSRAGHNFRKLLNRRFYGH